MERKIFALVAALALTGCADGGNPLVGSTEGETDTDTTTDTAGISDTLTKNLVSISDPDGSQVLVNIASLDGTPLEATFVRRSDLDTSGYVAYALQEDPLDRLFIALTATSNDNSTRAAIVHSGSQFNRYLDGGFYERIGPYNAPFVSDGPGEGQVSYAGTYAGVTNIVPAARGAGLLPIPGTVDPNTLPDLPEENVRVNALIFFNANFADNAINGEIYNRDLIAPSDGSVISRQPNIELIVTDITENGDFLGNAEIAGAVGVDVGDYGGIFGGTDAASVSGVVILEDFNENLEDEEEIGIFVLTQCGQDGDSALCDIVEP